MKYYVLLLTAGLLFSRVYAGPSDCCEPFQIYNSTPHHLYFGVNRLNYDLNTTVKNIKIKGPDHFIGVQLGYEYLKPCALYFGIDIFSLQSNEHLKAKRHAQPSKDLSDEKTRFGNLDLRLGYSYLARNWLLTPFLSLGSYLLDPRKHHNKGYCEETPYLALGVRTQYAISSKFHLGANLRFFRAFEKEQKLNFEGIKHKKVSNSWGGEVGVPFIWFPGCTHMWDIQLEPYLLILKFSEKQNNYGTRLILGYRF